VDLKNDHGFDILDPTLLEPPSSLPLHKHTLHHSSLSGLVCMKRTTYLQQPTCLQTSLSVFPTVSSFLRASKVSSDPVFHPSTPSSIHQHYCKIFTAKIPPSNSALYLLLTYFQVTSSK